MIDISQVAPYLAITLAFISILGHAKAFFGADGKRAAEKLAELEKALDVHEKRLLTLEAQMQQLPDRDAHHRVELALVEMNGRFAAMEEKMKPIAATSERLHELLLEQSKR